MIDVKLKRILEEMLHRPYYCETALVNVVLAEDKIVRSNWNGHFVIGHPGFDGVEFQIDPNSGHTEVLAYYPNTGEIGPVASSIEDLLQKWENDEVQYPF